MVRSLSVALAAAALSALSLVSLPVRAQDASEEMKYVPLDLLIHGQGQIADVAFVVVGCRWADGKHQIAIAKPSQAIRCDVRGPLSVYTLAKTDVAPLEALLAKDAGSPNEEKDAKKALGTAKLCGKIDENTRFEADKEITLLTAHYSIKRTDGECTLKKQGNTVPQTPELRHPPLRPSATAPAAPVSADPAPSEAAAPKSGCMCGGCVVAPRSRIDTLAGAGAIATAQAAIARRRRPRGGGGSGGRS